METEKRKLNQMNRIQIYYSANFITEFYYFCMASSMQQGQEALLT